MYPKPTFEQIKQAILTERENLLGVSTSPDSDAAIRAAGTAAVVEGLYDHQEYVQRQLFASSADEEYLVYHGIRESIDRHTGSFATGLVVVTGDTGAIVPANTPLSDSLGGSYKTTAIAAIDSSGSATVAVVANSKGAALNRQQGSTLILSSVPSGIDSEAVVVVLSGGESAETVGAWRQRIVNARRAGARLDRLGDYERVALGVSGVAGAYGFAQRRGLGSCDVCIIAVGTGEPTLPSPSLLSTVQSTLESNKPAHVSVKAYAPEIIEADVTATITGTASLSVCEAVMRQYIASLAPAETLLASEIIARLKALAGVVDVTLSSSNIIPENNWQRTQWVRAGVIVAVAA